MSLVWGLVVAVCCAPAIAVFARRFGIVDRPGNLKIHERPIPLLGGVAVGIAWIAAAAIAGAHVPGGVVAAVGVSFAVGLLDDLRTLPPLVRIAGQTGAGAVLVATGFRIGPLGFLAIPVTILATIASCNGVNLVDGLDGLAAGCAALSAAGIAAIAVGSGLSGAPALALVGAASGFLVWNVRPARMFLGDAGAYMIGTALIALVAMAAHAIGFRALAGAACCFGVFIVEPVEAMVRRIARGQPVTSGDRDHMYDRLARRLGSIRIAVAAMWGYQAIAVAVGVSLARRPAALPLTIAVGVAAVVLPRTAMRRNAPVATTGRESAADHR